MKHKPILFDTNNSVNSKPPQKTIGIAIYNFIMSLTSGTAKIIIISILSIVGSLFLTVLVTSLMQERSATEVFYELAHKIKSLV